MPTADLATCQQIQCGAITQAQAGIALLQACSEAGYIGVHDCNDPICAPYKDQMTANGFCPPAPAPGPPVTKLYLPTPPPSATTNTLPSIVGQANSDASQAGQVSMTRILNAQSLLQPLPQIVPSPPAEPLPQVCNSFAAWVSNNPFLAAALLVAGFMMVTQEN